MWRWAARIWKWRIFRNVAKYSPNSSASHSRRLISSATQRDNPKSLIYAQIHKKPSLGLSPPQTTVIHSAHFFKALHYCHHKYAQARLPRIFRLQFLIPRESYMSLPSQHCHLIRRRASLCVQFYPSAGYLGPNLLVFNLKVQQSYRIPGVVT